MTSIKPLQSGAELMKKLGELHGGEIPFRIATPTFDYWLGALKVGLVVVPLGAEHDIAQARLPAGPGPRMTVKRAQKIRALHQDGRSRNSLWRMFQTTPQMVDDILAGRAHPPLRLRSK